MFPPPRKHVSGVLDQHDRVGPALYLEFGLALTSVALVGGCVLWLRARSALQVDVVLPSECIAPLKPTMFQVSRTV